MANQTENLEEITENQTESITGIDVETLKREIEEKQALLKEVKAREEETRREQLRIDFENIIKVNHKLSKKDVETINSYIDMVSSASKSTARRRLKHSKDIFGDNLEDKIKFMMEQHNTNKINELMELVNKREVEFGLDAYATGDVNRIKKKLNLE